MHSLIRIVFTILFALSPIEKVKHVSEKNEILISDVRTVARVTGKFLPDEGFPSPNSTAEQYDVGGTDLGIMWKMADDKIGLFFGDTNGKDYVPFKNNGGGNGSNWRSNVLAFSTDKNLDDGLNISTMALDGEGRAREIAAGAKANPDVYQTSIPTGAVHSNGADYVHYMNIYEWAAPKGRWLTNFSSLYASYDGGDHWERKEQVTFGADSKFSQVCYAKSDGFVYMLGTLAGRGSAAYLARFREKDIEKIKDYEYWSGDENSWMKGDEAAATAVIPGPVGEASLLYHEKFKKWIIMYSYDPAFDVDPVTKGHAILYRSAEKLNEKWSGKKVLTTAQKFPGLYSPYIYPLQNKEDTLYFTISLWGPYNVFLMKADIGVNN